MAITEITAETLGKKKSGWRWDKKRELFVSFQVDTTFDGSRHVRRGFLTERAAQDYVDQLKIQERLKQIGVVSLVKFPTLKKLFDIHSSKLESRKAITTAKRVFDKFLTQLPPKIRLDELKRKHFKDFCDLRISEGLKPESANREITEISSALHKAGDYFADLENWAVPKIYRPQISDEGRDRVIVKDERTRLINHLLRDEESSEGKKNFEARRRTGLFLYFALLTGLRHGEICGIEKKNFDARRRRLKAERFKTKKHGVRWTVFEPLTETQLWILNEAAKLFPKGDFFFSRAGKIHNRIYSILKENCKKLDIPYGHKIDGGFVPHDARHTFVTTLEHGSVDSSTTRSFSGHSKDSMMKRYAHATPDSRARAMQIIERELGGTAGDPDADLKKIYALNKADKISFDQFKTAVETFYGFLTNSVDFDVQNVQDVQAADSDFIQ